jgi:hypothetical protein
MCLIGSGHFSLKRFRPLAVVSVAPILLYAAVYSEFRYVAASFTILWLCAFMGFQGDHKVVRYCIAAAIATTVLVCSFQVVSDRPTVEYWSRAESVRAPSLVACGHEPWDSVFIARLAKAKIIGEPPVTSFSNVR